MRYFKSILLLFIITIFTVNLAQAQDDDVIRVDTNLISVGVVVNDQKGNYVKGLTKEQFEIFDNKNKQEIVFFSAEESPISFGIVYDLHPTTSQRTRVILNSLKKFTDELRNKDDFFTIVFNKRGSLNLNFIPTEEQVRRHLSFGERSEPNSLYDAVFMASEKLQKRPNPKKTLIIISDGKDQYSRHSFSELSKKLKSYNVQIYAILLDEAEKWGYSDLLLDEQPRIIKIDESSLDRSAIKELSRKSGGKTETPLARNSQELLEIYEQISSEMRQQYSIGFYPQKLDNKLHKIKIKVKPNDKKQKLSLTYRKNYQKSEKAQ